MNGVNRNLQYHVIWRDTEADLEKAVQAAVLAGYESVGPMIVCIKDRQYLRIVGANPDRISVGAVPGSV
jgi:hypothetical protein